ncbi:malate synthase A [bacterium]|nr:malate synthase A [bacterium]
MHPLAVTGALKPGYERILTPAALRFVAGLALRFENDRKTLLAMRSERARDYVAGKLPDFLSETEAIRQETWRVAPAPRDLTDRRVEITGPAERKMMINALNSGAQVFMADLEDALSPTWDNVLQGQLNLMDAVRRTIRFEAPGGKVYRLVDSPATLVVRPRGWHLSEKHVLLDGEPISGSLFDFGLYLFHNAQALRERGTGPYFYLPKLEGHLEARLWNDVFVFAEDTLGLTRGTVRATVLIETILAAFEMDEILYELRGHIAGLNAGRWDYLFSIIKKLGMQRAFLLPDRAQLTMEAPFMRAYTTRLVQTCHRRGAHAIGGMAAYIPSRKDPVVNARALSKVQEDKEREALEGFDGTWVAHPDLVPIARGVFERVLENRPHQLSAMPQREVSAHDLLDVRIPGAAVTAQGVKTNLEVALHYLSAWLQGNGAVAIHDLMEDAATAEISRAQLWQWRMLEAPLEDGRRFDAATYRAVRDQELARLRGTIAWPLTEAATLLDQLVLNDEFEEFLTLSAYQALTP